MKADIAERWTAALRSGTYTQGTGYLDRNGEQCCLGVLCYLAVAEGVIEPPTEGEHDEGGNTVLVFGSGGARVQLPTEVLLWAEMHTRFGQFKSDMSDDCLDGLNDTLDDDGNHEYPFPAIADVIERHVEEL